MNRAYFEVDSNSCIFKKDFIKKVLEKIQINFNLYNVATLAAYEFKSDQNQKVQIFKYSLCNIYI